MKPLHILTAASLAAALPTPLEQRGPLIDAITATLNTAKTAINTNFAAIHDTLASIKGTVGGLAPQVEALVQTNLKQALSSLQTARDAMQSTVATVNSVVKTTPAALTYAELEQLKMAFTQTQDLLLSVKAGLQSSTIELGPAIDGAISAEMEAIRTFVNQFTQPIQGLADAVKLAGSRGNLQAIAFGQVLGGLLPIVKTLAGSV
ncbi:hypothetical protein Micbo1qcDRAFT_202785 [Microdochium bolleyi]|uniref:Hydrophobic surface binding protein A-domain-containing protein n=1 Tax=Microdochium bolleyi TaxID=196109 RepID=A0A136J5U2_9PEZI|nr:hypothetical protein Micbo1qcDRAFT_202785 [Microdochium bolleyi]